MQELLWEFLEKSKVEISHAIYGKIFEGIFEKVSKKLQIFFLEKYPTLHRSIDSFMNNYKLSLEVFSEISFKKTLQVFFYTYNLLGIASEITLAVLPEISPRTILENL